MTCRAQEKENGNFRQRRHASDVETLLNAPNL